EPWGRISTLELPNSSIIWESLPVASPGHGESCGARAILGLDDLITTELDAVDKSVVLVIRDGHGGSDLAEERDDGLAGVAADDGHVELGDGLAGDLRYEGLGADNVQSSDTEETLWVEDVLGLENLGGDG